MDLPDKKLDIFILSGYDGVPITGCAMPKRASDEILTTAETCRYLKVAPRTLYRYIQERRVPAFKLGKDWRFVKSELDQWLRKKSQEHFRSKPS